MTLVVEYRILGPVEVWRGGRLLSLGGAKVRTLLAVLLAHANTVVGVDRLVDDVWDDDPPQSARNLVQAYVSRLRAQLRWPESEGALLTRPSGYLLRVARGQLDLHRFEDLVDEAERAAVEGNAEVAADRLRAALAVWRGPALAGAASDALLRTVGVRLEEQRLTALEKRIQAELQLGHHGELIGELTELVAAYPLRERLRGQLMVALYRSGRQAEALQAYGAARDVLTSELGIEPEPELQRLERDIRSADPALRAGSAALAGTAYRPSRPGPFQLPSTIRDFTGRSEPLAAAWRSLAGDGGGNEPLSAPILVVTGAPGVGKTALAVQLAHQMRALFPDGQLFVDLHGAEAHPLDPGDVLAGFLRAFGMYGTAIPHDQEERAALYRALLSDQRALIVLDNAACESQVRPLLPSGTGCAVLVTSRAALAGLEGAITLPLTVLRLPEAVELLARVTGEARVGAELGAAHTIVELCGGLPLAVRIAGARLSSKPHWRLAKLAGRLGDERCRLDELKVGDLEVRTSLTLCHQGLDEPARRAFRLLGLFGPSGFAVWQVASLLDVDGATAEALVERLGDAHLCEAGVEDSAGQTRYHFHALVRVFAHERLQEAETAASWRAALERVLGARLALAERARAALSPGDALHVPRGTALRRLPDEPRVVAAVEKAPLGWFESERADLLAAIEQASDAGLSELAWELACSLPSFLAIRGYWQDWCPAKLSALAANRRAGNRQGEAHLLYGLGQSHLGVGDLDGATASFEQSLGLYRELANRQAERFTLLALGLVMAFGGRLEAAASRYEACLALFQEAGEWYGVALARHGLADVQRMQGRLAEADAGLEQCLAVFREAGERYWEGSVLRVMGEVRRRQGRLEEAACLFEQCLVIFRDFRDHYLEAGVLARLGKLHLALGRLREAIACLEQCVAVCERQNFHAWEARAREALADARQRSC